MKSSELPKTISVFPLSNFIIFPNTTVPLNIFEPRYIVHFGQVLISHSTVYLVDP